MTKPTHAYLRIWRLRPEPRLVRELHGLPRYTWATFSPDGTTVAATGSPQSNPGGVPQEEHGDGLVAEWNAARGKLLARPTRLVGGGEAIDVAFPAHGTTVAVDQLGDMAAVVDPARRKVVVHWKDSYTAAAALGAAFAPDGKRVATVDVDGWLRVWDAASGKQVLPAIRASGGWADSVDWSKDGSRLVTAGTDGTVRIYDASSGRQIGTPLPISGAVVPYAAFSQDGRTIAATDVTGRVWLYPTTAAGLEAYACRLANRDLTRAEWSKFVPGHAYRRVCSATGAR